MLRLHTHYMVCHIICHFKRRTISQRSFTISLAKAALFAITLTPLVAVYAEKKSDAQNIIPLEQLASEYTNVLGSYYREYTKSITPSTPNTSLKALQSQVVRLVKQEKFERAIATILANKARIFDNIDSDETLYFLQLLFDAGAPPLTSELAQYALENSSAFMTSNVNYLLGVYYFQQNNFQKALAHLSAIESSEALPKDYRDYATLIFGISLQNLKKHRESLDIYKRIKESSPFYSQALLNIAVANIRQGWWTDAHIAIEAALDLPSPKDRKEEHNRLLLVLAYSQLQNEFYRNARNTFRKISINSIYANKALLGIGLCAMHQKDYAGAINVFSRLQESNTNSLSVMESNLLLPYTYERIGKLDEASLRYSEAIAYYNIKKREIETQLTQLSEGTRSSSEDLTGVSPSLYKYHQHISALSPRRIATLSASQQQRLQKLKVSIDHHINNALSDIKQDKITKIQSYLSQSQYGLAKLYDSQ